MRKMGDHANRLGWAAGWFKIFSYLSWAVSIFSVLAFILFLFYGQPFVVISGAPVRISQLIQSAITSFVASLVTGFLWRTGYYVLDFLSDFAGGLYAQQIKRERQNQQP